MRDSNPRSRDQNPLPYRLANPQRRYLLYHTWLFHRLFKFSLKKHLHLVLTHCIFVVRAKVQTNNQQKFRLLVLYQAQLSPPHNSLNGLYDRPRKPAPLPVFVFLYQQSFVARRSDLRANKKCEFNFHQIHISLNILISLSLLSFPCYFS